MKGQELFVVGLKLAHLLVVLLVFEVHLELLAHVHGGCALLALVVQVRLQVADSLDQHLSKTKQAIRLIVMMIANKLKKNK